VGLITLAGLMFKALDYGGGVDLWNVPKAKYKRFTKVIPTPAIKYLNDHLTELLRHFTT